MGKKSRVKTQKSGTGATASVSPKETLNLTSELLQSKLCSWPSRLSVGRVVCTPASAVLLGNISCPLNHEVSHVTWASYSTSYLTVSPPVKWSCCYLWGPCNYNEAWMTHWMWNPHGTGSQKVGFPGHQQTATVSAVFNSVASDQLNPSNPQCSSQ